MGTTPWLSSNPAFDDYARIRFLQKITYVAKSGCWIWRACKRPTSEKWRRMRTSRGQTASVYGAFKLRGKNELAHRASYMLFIGKIPEGDVVAHNCDIPLCVNPAHLKCCSASENLEDAYDRDRRTKDDGVPF